jgi:plasmid stability protein
LIRNVDAALHAKLKRRAAKHHRSLEEEARELLRTAMVHQPKEEHIVDLALRLFGPKHGFELDIPPRDSEQERPPPDFTEH